MADADQVVNVTPLTRPVRFVAREALYAAGAGTMYLSGASDSVSNVLAKPLPRFLRRNSKCEEPIDRRLASSDTHFAQAWDSENAAA